MRTLLLGLPLLLVTACASPRLSSRCSAEVNRCLETCPPRLSTPTRQNEGGSYLTADTRSVCEERCANQGRSCQKREKADRREPPPEAKPVAP